MNKKGMDPEDLDEDEFEELEEEEKPRRTLKKKGVKKKPVQRYMAFNVPQRVGVADSETNEILAEGEMGIYEMLAKIYSKQEKLELQIGQIMEE